MPKKFRSNTRELPLGTFDFDGVGWDRSRFLQVARARWSFRREGFSLTATYTNLVSQKTHELGVLSPATTDRMILEWFAGQRDSHTPCDLLDLNGRLLWLTLDGGEA